MEEKEVLSKVAAAVTDEPVKITIDILYPKPIEEPKYSRLDKVLIKAGIKEPKVIEQPATKRTFIVKKAPIRTLVKISKELIDMNIDILDGGPNVLENNYHLIVNQGPRMAMISAIAVTPPNEKPPDELVNFFMDNLSSEELMRLVTIVFQQMDIFTFMNTTILIKGTNILGKKTASVTSAKPNEVGRAAEGIIASGQQ